MKYNISMYNLLKSFNKRKNLIFEKKKTEKSKSDKIIKLNNILVQRAGKVLQIVIFTIFPVTTTTVTYLVKYWKKRKK